MAASGDTGPLVNGVADAILFDKRLSKILAGFFLPELVGNTFGYFFFYCNHLNYPWYLLRLQVV